MRIANLKDRLVLVKDGLAVDVEKASGGAFSSSPQDVYLRWDEFRRWAADLGDVQGETYKVEDLGSPAPKPSQLVAVGLNYREHALEAGYSAPEGLPPVFTKFASSITGPYSNVILPEGNVDWEIELGVVIGKTASSVDEAKAWDYVAGFTIIQDLSERVLQMSGPAPQFSLGKSFPGFAPMGPYVVSIDEIDDPENLDLKCWVNDELVQDGNTRELIFPIPTLIARISEVMTLSPGDVILSGTPAGVGFGRKPPRYLRAGDVLVSEIQGIGQLRQNLVSA